MTVPVTASFTSADLTDEVTQQVIADLKLGLPQFERGLSDKGLARTGRGGVPETLIQDVFRGLATRISGLAAIRVVTLNKPTEWMATRVRSDRYNFAVDVLSKASQKAAIIEEVINTLGPLVQSYLNRFENLQPEIGNTGVKAYNAWAEDFDKGYSEDRGYRVGRIPYSIWIMNPYTAGVTAQSC